MLFFCTALKSYRPDINQSPKQSKYSGSYDKEIIFELPLLNLYWGVHEI